MTERANHRRRAVHNFSIIQLHHNLPQPRAIHRLAPSLARPSSSSRSFERPASSSHAHRRQSRHQSPDHDHAHRAHAHERLFRRRRVSTVPPRPLIEHEYRVRGVTLPMSPSTFDVPTVARASRASRTIGRGRSSIGRACTARRCRPEGSRVPVDADRGRVGSRLRAAPTLEFTTSITKGTPPNYY